MNDWITSAAAVKRVSKVGHADPSVLGQWAKAGLLRARALSEKMNGQTIENSSTVEIPLTFWEALDEAPVKEDWMGGILEVRPQFGARNWSEAGRWLLVGVEFHRQDLERLTGMETEEAPAVPSGEEKKNIRGAGAKADKPRWEKVGAAMAVLAMKGQIDFDEAGNVTHGKIETFMNEMGEEDCLGVDSVRGMIQLFQEWRPKSSKTNDD